MCIGIHIWTHIFYPHERLLCVLCLSMDSFLLTRMYGQSALILACTEGDFEITNRKLRNFTFGTQDCKAFLPFFGIDPHLNDQTSGLQSIVVLPYARFIKKLRDPKTSLKCLPQMEIWLQSTCDMTFGLIAAVNSIAIIPSPMESFHRFDTSGQLKGVLFVRPSNNNIYLCVCFR